MIGLKASSSYQKGAQNTRTANAKTNVLLEFSHLVKIEESAIACDLRVSFQSCFLGSLRDRGRRTLRSERIRSGHPGPQALAEDSRKRRIREVS